MEGASALSFIFLFARFASSFMRKNSNRKGEFTMLNKLFDKIIIERHHLILEKEDVTRVLEVISRNHKFTPRVQVRDCGWANDPNKWFIFFDVSRAGWETIRYELDIKRMFTYKDIPENTVGVIYTTD